MSRVSDIDDHDPLLQRSRKLAAAVEPQNDLWPGIRDRLTGRTGFSWTSPRLALAAVLLVSISSTLTVWLGGEFQNVDHGGQLNDLNPGYVNVGYSLPLQAMGPQFVQDRTDLILSLERELDELSPESRKVLAENLNNIDEAIRQINVALEDSPESELLLHLLLSTYTDQLTLLGTINGMTRSANESERTQL